MRAKLLFILCCALAGLGVARADDRASGAVEERGALAAQEKLVRAQPESVPARIAYAECLADHGQMRAAIMQWRTAQLLDPANAAIANSLGGAYLRTGRAADSARQFQRATEMASGVAAYHYNLANVEFMLRRDLTAAWHIDTPDLLQRALAEFREASRLSPHDLEYARGYAETFYGLPDPDWNEAEAAWKHVLDLSVRRDFACLQLARVSLKLGHKEEARLFLDRISDSRHDGLKRKLRDQADQL